MSYSSIYPYFTVIFFKIYAVEVDQSINNAHITNKTITLYNQPSRLCRIIKRTINI